MKSKGSASMRVIAILMLIVALAGLSYAVYVPTDINYDIASNPESLSVFLRDVLGNMASDAYLFNPRATAPQAVEGRMYYDSGTNSWIGYNGTSWQTFDRAGGVGLNGAYDFGGAGSGAEILANDGAVIISNAQADAAPLLQLTYTGGANDAHGLIVTTNATGAAIEIENTGTGPDLEGTAGWTLSRTGQIVGLDLDLTGANGITLQNDETITNAADGKITFTTNGGTANTLIFDLQAGAAAVQLESGDVTEFQFGDVDDLTQVGTIVFDDAATAEITMTGTGSNNFTITQAGVADESLILRSAGNPVDAIRIVASDAAGGIDIDANNDIDILLTASTDAEDILISNEGNHDSSIILTAGGNGTDAIKLETTNASGDIWIDSGDVLTFTSVDYKMFDGVATEVWRIDGTAAGSYHSISFTDATANIIWTFPDGGADTLAIMGSTLETNYPEVTNSVTGGTNQLIFEGTANTEETILTANDATTADATLELPNDSGDLTYAPVGVVDYAASAGVLPITHVCITYESTGGAEALTIPDGQPGQILHVVHDTDGGNGVITPDTALGYTSIDLADAGDMVTFMYVDTQGWIIIGTAGNTAPPVVTP